MVVGIRRNAARGSNNRGDVALPEAASSACRTQEPAIQERYEAFEVSTGAVIMGAPHMNARPRPTARPASLLFLAIAACGFPRPPDVADDAPGDGGGSSSPGVAVHVSPSGDDANDGLLLPVKTLKHAIGLAAANTKIAQIVLTSGSYSMSSGETFPYTVPPSVTIVGPAGGGAILAGTKTGPGITLDAGGLQDLDLQDFTTAISVTGTASLKNVRVLTSTIAVQAETAADLTVDNLDITGTDVAVAGGSCSTGIVLNGSAKLMAATLATRNLGTTLDARDHSVSAVASATISGGANCAQTTQLISIVSTASFTLSDSLLDGGIAGISIDAKSTSFQATISNTIIRNMKAGALTGGFSDAAASFQMTGGELSNSEQSAAQLGSGTWAFTNVTIQKNKNLGFYLQDGTLIMRGCTVADNGLGIDVDASATADLGTVTSPGNNVFQRNMEVGVAINSGFAVSAVGNTWNANTQGADKNGKYTTTATVPGPITSVNGDNFSVLEGSSLSR